MADEAANRLYMIDRFGFFQRIGPPGYPDLPVGSISGCDDGVIVSPEISPGPKPEIHVVTGSPVARPDLQNNNEYYRTYPGSNEVFAFDILSRHVRTHHALTGAIIYSFAYDADSRLVGITDATGNTTQILRDGSGSHGHPVPVRRRNST